MMVNQNLTLESGFAAGTCIPLVLTVIKDGVLESDETLQLSASDASSHAMPSSDNGGTTLITVIDDDSTCKCCKRPLRLLYCHTNAYRACILDVKYCICMSVGIHYFTLVQEVS